ncbi:MAG TPA: hypothetical protein PK784_01115 [Tenuifilaceae bacterium]|nr:hypothetical protein [Tenuifilaceae bacterium]HPN22868.1 hypothetical protein [Tenuifilaceae bacterium]
MGKRILCILITLLLSTSDDLLSQNRNIPEYKSDSIGIEKQLDSIEKYINFNEHQTAYALTLEGLNKYSSTTYKIGKIKLLERAASINCHYEYKLDSSVYYLNEMRKLSAEAGFKKGLLWYENILGRIYYLQKDFSNANKFFKSAYTQSVELNDSVGIADILATLSYIQIINKEYDSAKQSIHKALDITQYYSMARTDIMLYDRMGRIFQETNQYDSSIHYYKKALETSESIQSRQGILTSEFNIAYINYLQNPKVDIEKLLKEIMRKTRNEGFLRIYIGAGYFLADVYEEKKEFEKALISYKMIREFEDSLIGNERVREVVERESSFYLNQKEVENQQLMKDAEIRELALRNRKIIIYFTAFTLIISILFLRNIYKKYKVIKDNIETIRNKDRIIFEQEKALIQSEKEIIEQKLELQNKELSSKLMKIYQHQEIIENITSELVGLKNELSSSLKGSKEASSKVQNIINQINTSNNEQLWSEFEATFNETNPDYLKRLSERFPDLTPNDLKLCIFLNMNLRTKEISVITQQNIKTIEVARTRLRKKLGLDNTNTNITAFLKQI